MWPRLSCLLSSIRTIQPLFSLSPHTITSNSTIRLQHTRGRTIVSTTLKMLPPFRVKNIISPDSTPQSSSSATSSSAPPAARRSSSYTHGIIRMSKEAYDDLLKRLPEAVLSYIDEEDDEVVLVSDSSSSHYTVKQDS